MALFTVDSNKTFGQGVAEAGTYNVKISNDSYSSLSKSSGNEMATLNFEVLDGKYKGGKIMYNYLVWDPSDVELSEKRFNTLLVAIGVPDGTDIESIKQLVTASKGKQLNITADWVENDNGKYFLKARSYQPLDTEGSKPNGKKRPDGDKQASSSNTSNAPKSTKSNDPFANGGQSIDISDEDLPF